MQKKRVLDDILHLDQCHREYTYQYLNEDYYLETIVMICLKFALFSLQNDKRISVDKLKINDPLEYEGKYYFFKGCNGEICNLKPDTRSRNPFILSLPIERLEKYAHRTKTVKKRRASGYLNEFAKHFGLDLKGLTGDEQIAVLLPKNVYEKVIRARFSVKGKKLFFSQICASSYLTSGGNMQTSLHADSAETPFVLFSSNASEFVNYIDDEGDRLRGIYVFGDKWFGTRILPETRSLPDLAKMNNLSIALFSSNRVLLNNESLELINTIDSNQNWLFQYSEDLTLKVVHTNEEFKENIAYLVDSLKEIDTDSMFRYLSKLMWTALRISLSLAEINSKTLRHQINQVEEYLKVLRGLTVSEQEDIINKLRSLLNNRFGAQMKKTILKTVDSISRYALIVPDALKEDYDLLFKQENVIIFSFRDEITEDMYDKFDALILVNPYAQERKKWVQAFLAPNVVLLMPEIFLKPFQRSIKNEERLILNLKNGKRLKENASFKTSYEAALSSLVSDLKEYLNRKQKLTNVSNLIVNDSEIADELETNEEEVRSTNEIYGEKIKLRAEIFADKHTDNAKVEVHKVFQLSDGYELYGTDNAKIFTVDQDGMLIRRSINDISKKDKIIDFIIPYSDSYYREWFKRLSEREIVPNNTNEINDFRWKRDFINYINKHEYSAVTIKKEMESLGAPKHTTAYYASWSDINKMPILPREESFIQYVGKLIGNEVIENDYLSFYRSSEIIKKNFSKSREAELNGLNHQKLSNVNQKFLMGEIVSTKEVDIPNVPRFMTNTLLRG